ncbi:MAG TPA: TlpA disulfide reductase family protein [Nitriliruptoraceae bacterium]|nr:TlpA disulfide reductase family protein [Nitriliruptoraceae bacterium]
MVFWSMLGFLAFLVLLGFALRTGQTPDGGQMAADSPGVVHPVQQEFSATVTVSGSALEPLDPNATSAAQDPTLGSPAPTVAGEDFAGNTVTVPTPGEATIVVFLAHWCPHCQAEFPRLLDAWITPDLPQGVEVVAIPTAQADDRPNWPPSEWMLGGQPAWDESVLLDTPNQDAARALGVTSYPYFLVIAPDGDVAARVAGEQGVEGLTAMVDFAAGLD